jgi:hypothetical protein
MSLFIWIESSSSGYRRGNPNQRTVISSSYCKTIKELAGFCAGYFTLFKTLRTMVIYISQEPGIWLIWSQLLSTFARKFVWIVVVVVVVVGNNMSNLALIFFLCHFGLFVLVAYRVCIERVLKEFPWFFLCFFFVFGFFFSDLHNLHWERSFWRGWHDFWGFWLGWSIEFALREREREILREFHDLWVFGLVGICTKREFWREIPWLLGVFVDL